LPRPPIGGASDSDSYAWKKFGSDSSSGGNPFLAVTYTTDGAKYSLGSRTPVANVTPTGNGKIAVKVTNTGSSTWTSSNGYEISYRAYNARGQEVANHPVFTAMPSTVSPGQTVTVDVAVNSLPAGSYALDFDMYSGATGSSPVSFSSQGIAPYAMGLSVPEPPPVVSAVYPPTGFTSTTLQQQLSTSATGDGTLKYDFTLTCEPLAGQTCADSSVSSGSISTPYWTPPAADLDWDIPYEWSVTVSVTSGSDTSTTTVGPVGIEADVPQPSVTSSLGGSSGQAYDPLSGNYTTSATDAAVKSAGPALEIDRTYNSLDPRTSGAFGAGWSSLADASLADDTANSKTVLVTLPTGQQMRFGENGDGSYAAPEGSPDALKGSSSASWTLRDSAGNRYAFTGAGQLTSITDENGYAQDFAYNSSNQLTTITDAISGRTLTLTWSTPSGASYPHVATVATQAPGSGDAAYTWTYSYTGDELTQACAPAVSGSGCTAYTYGSGSQYEQSVQDADPRVDWQLGENGDQAARDTVITNLGNDLGTYHNVTQGVAGPLAGSSQTAASFDGTDSSVWLPSGLISEDTDVSVGLWFKAGSSSTGGVLYGYSTDSLSNSGGNSAHHVPALYIGANGELYGEFYNGSADPLHASSSVEDGNWHYAVLSGDSSSQSLFLDGSLVGTLSGQIDQLNQTVDTIGAGFWESWPEDTQGGTAIPSTLDGNPYAYANGNPLTGTDPTGHFMELQPGGGAAVAAPATVGCLAFIEICAAGVGAVAVGAGIGFGIWYLTGGSSGPGSQSLPGSGNFLQQYLDGLSAPGSGGAGLSPTTATPDDAQSPDDYLQDNPGSSLDDGAIPGPCGFYACPPPPPPPPPQDIYAEGAKIQKASKSLLDDQVITRVVKDVTSASKLLGGAGSIKETVKPATTTVQGTTAGSSNITTSNAGDVDENTIFQQIIQDIGIPEEPGPETQLQPASAGSGNGGRGTTTGVAAGSDDSGGNGNGGPSFGSRLASLAKNAASKVWPGWKQVGIGAVSGAASNYLSGVEQKQTGSQLWEDIGLGAVTGAASNLGSGPVAGLVAGAGSGFLNGAGSQMIGTRSSKVNYGWAGVDAVLGAAENYTGYRMAKNLPTDGDSSPGNYASGGAGIFASGICGWLDNSEVQKNDYGIVKSADC
jgi:YD repeat-containing protein